MSSQSIRETLRLFCQSLSVSQAMCWCRMRLCCVFNFFSSEASWCYCSYLTLFSSFYWARYIWYSFYSTRDSSPFGRFPSWSFVSTNFRYFFGSLLSGPLRASAPKNSILHAPEAVSPTGPVPVAAPLLSRGLLQYLCGRLAQLEARRWSLPCWMTSASNARSLSLLLRILSGHASTAHCFSLGLWILAHCPRWSSKVLRCWWE